MSVGGATRTDIGVRTRSVILRVISQVSRYARPWVTIEMQSRVKRRLEPGHPLHEIVGSH